MKSIGYIDDLVNAVIVFYVLGCICRGLLAL